MDPSDLPSLCWQVASTNAPCPIFILAEDLSVVWSNPAADEYVHQVGQTTFLACLPPEDRSPQSAVWQASTKVNLLTGRDDRPFRIHHHDGCFIILATTWEHVSERTARRDPLTQLRGRDSLHRCLTKALESARRDWGILFLDLDNYKQINDRHGHLTGDFVLQEFAQQLAANTRATDAVFRYGGDEFVMVVNAVTEQSLLREIGERLCRDTVVLVEAENPPRRVTASVGCAMASPHGTDAETLLSRADRDLYRSKRLGPPTRDNDRHNRNSGDQPG